jgi:hypothetical protein
VLVRDVDPGTATILADAYLLLTAGSAPPTGAEPPRLNPVAYRAGVPAPASRLPGPAAEAGPAWRERRRRAVSVGELCGWCTVVARSVLLRVVRQRAAVAPASTVGGRGRPAIWSTRRDSIYRGILPTCRPASVGGRSPVGSTQPRAPHQPWRALCVLSRRDRRCPRRGCCGRPGEQGQQRALAVISSPDGALIVSSPRRRSGGHLTARSGARAVWSR